MAEQVPFYKKFPWLYVVTGAVLVAYVIFVVMQNAKVNALNHMQSITLQQVAQERPTTGNYQVTGGQLNYTYAQAVDFRNDAEKDAGTDYDSYVPYVDPKTNQTVMLVKILHEDPRHLLIHRDDPPQQVIGFFQDPSIVEPEIYQDFANRQFQVQPNLPVMELAGGIDPAAVRVKQIVIGVALLLGLGGLWTVMYFISRPKKRQKSFSERYPQRRVY